MPSLHERGDANADLPYLRTPRAIRERAEAVYALGLRGELLHFDIEETRLTDVAARVARVTRTAYPDVRAIPYHARFRHFGAGGTDRMAHLETWLGTLSPDERLAALFELAITSVLLDAGAGPAWAYVERSGARFTRSEGLAVASFDLFCSGGLSSGTGKKEGRLSADAQVLAHLTEADLARAFQVRPDNPLVGLAGRVGVLRRLGDVVQWTPRYFSAAPTTRLGNLGLYLVTQARDGALPAAVILTTVLDALGHIWPARDPGAATSGSGDPGAATAGTGVQLGDVWPHPLVGLVPFHKLSQWLTYSLVEPLEGRGIAVTGLSELTGLAEYRNGGLFVDSGVLVPKQASILLDVHDISSSVVVEWRALTVALLDRTAALVRSLLGLNAEELPLARVLEGGTWSAGREIALERRNDGAPPIRVHSDGTVF